MARRVTNMTFGEDYSIAVATCNSSLSTPIHVLFHLVTFLILSYWTANQANKRQHVVLNILVKDSKALLLSNSSSKRNDPIKCSSLKL